MAFLRRHNRACAVHRRGPPAQRADLSAARLSSLRRRRGRPSGHRPRDRAGADRVPARLEHRPPAHHPRLLRLGRPGRRLHRRRPARDAGGRARLLPARPVEHRLGVDALRARARALAAGPRRAPGLVHHPRHDPDRGPRAGVQEPDRGRVPHARARRLGAHPLLLRDAARRGRLAPRSRAVGDHAPRRPDHRLLPGAGAGAGRVALGRHDLRRPVPELRSHRRGALLVPALGARGRAVGPLRAAPRGRGRRRLGGRDGARDAAGLHHRLRVDRLPAALPRAPLDRRSSRPIASRSG